MMLDEYHLSPPCACEGCFYALRVAAQECEAGLHVLSQLAKRTWTAACDTSRLAQGQYNRISQRTVYCTLAQRRSCTGDTY